MVGVQVGRRHGVLMALAGLTAVLVSAGPASAEVAVTLPDNVAPGERVAVSADGLAARGSLTVSLNDAALVTLRADSDGTLDTEVALPENLAAGSYTLSVEGPGVQPSLSTLTVSAATGARNAATTARRSSAAILALPPGGAGANTPGTTSSVSPSSVAHGGSLSWSVSGYPAGETVYVKIDDGSYTGDGVVQGADIVTSTKIGSDGKASGKLTVPRDLTAGSHTLRFLASDVTDAGTLGYTHKSQTFTVTAAASPSTASSTSTSGTTTSTAGTSTTSSTSSLAKTGAPLLATAGLGVVAIIVGGALLRRRRSGR